MAQHERAPLRRAHVRRAFPLSCLSALRPSLSTLRLLALLTTLELTTCRSHSPAGMASVLQARLSEPVVRKVMLTAHKYTSAEALKDGLVDEVVEGTGSEESIKKALEKAVQLAPLSETGVSAGFASSSSARS